MTIQRLVAPSAAILALSLVIAGAVPARAQGAIPAPLPNQSAAPANDSSPFPPVNSKPAAPKPANSAASPFPPVNSARPAPAAAQASASPFPPVNGAAPAPGAFPTQGAAPVGLGLGGGGMGGPPPGGGAPPNQQECMGPFTKLRNEAEKRANLIRAASQRKAPPQEACRLIGDFANAEMKLISFVKSKAQTCGIPPTVGQQMSQAHAKTEQLRRNVCAAANGAPQGGPAPAPSLSEAIGSPVVPEAPTAKRSQGGGMFDTLSGNVLTR